LDSFISEYYDRPVILSPQDGAHYFFGYYDLPASQGRKHLCHRVSFMDRLPTAKDIAQLGYLENGEFVPFAETTAWNFQQGALLQYHRFKADTVFYNTFHNNRVCTAQHNYATGSISYTDRAAATISPDGNRGLAVNFGRIFAFRPGYGYAGCTDPWESCNAPAEDGVFLIDMNKGTSQLIVNYQTLAEASGFTPDQKVLVNHINFGPDSDHYVALVRNFPAPGQPLSWSTTLILGDCQGNVTPVLRNTYVSHYCWAGPDSLIAHCTVEGEKKSLYRLELSLKEWVEYDMPYFHEPGLTDIHCNLYPDGTFLIGDGYPKDGYRPIQYYHIPTGTAKTLLYVRTDEPDSWDIRCDLHNRYVFDGAAISFDTTHNDCRQIALIPLPPLP